VIWLLAASALAASPFYAEVAPIETRVDAAEVYQATLKRGMAVRMVRRYRHPSGWEYAVLCEGFEDRIQAVEAAEWLSARFSRGVAVYSREPVVETREVPLARLPETGALRIVQSLGGEGVGAKRLSEATHVYFVYDRTVEADGELLTMRHTWERYRGDYSLNTTPVGGGQGVESKARLTQGEVSFNVESEELPAPDPGRTADLLDLFGPERVFAAVLELPDLLLSEPEGLVSVPWSLGTPTTSVVLERKEIDSGIRILVDPRNHWPLRIAVLGDLGVEEVQFADWRDIDAALVVPFFIERSRESMLIERIRVVELVLDAQVEKPGSMPAEPLNSHP